MEQAHSTAANSTASQKFDFELTAADIQGIAGAEQLAAFFTRLGYNTAARMPQTTANLQLSEAVARPIRRIELLANNDRLLQVYFFELSSVTVANIRALSRAFRNFAGNFLLVLTADYEQLDFVLLKRELPSAEGQLGVPQAAIVPRRFTVNRRRAGPVELRVLRRLTWTEPHAIDQIDKLSYAFDVAHWSEAWFNNRALFSDYFLLHRLPARETGQPEFPEWLEDPKPAYQKLRGIYSGPAARFAGKRASELSEMLYEPLLRELGFEVRRSTQASAALLRLGDPSRPDETLAVCLAYPWGRELDRKDETRDAESPEVTPAFAVVELLATEPARWVILTNGRIWRLYSQRAHSRATNYYEVDLDEVLGRQRFQQDVQDAFRYFWLLFRMPAFRPASRPDRTGDKQEAEWEGQKRSLSMLDRLLLGSQQYAKELGESLKRRVFAEVFPHLSEGFIANIRRREGDAAEFGEERLAEIYQATLTLLYRLLFLLGASRRSLAGVA